MGIFSKEVRRLVESEWVAKAAVISLEAHHNAEMGAAVIAEQARCIAALESAYSQPEGPIGELESTIRAIRANHS